ncbi:hypothetical protein FIBSPDRAFT_961460 [Athelia psychrophila]|uniref:Uncharacterized protein n=1 Tax=Athelia psychrophila TaxID=1759441 RepID=A0A166B8U6_9AGAM|nr:hypothetical protein FIBSPDRAFT_961460 [Fibularhizoctonia sp. CBS 109695]
MSGSGRESQEAQLPPPLEATLSYHGSDDDDPDYLDPDVTSFPQQRFPLLSLNLDERCVDD